MKKEASKIPGEVKDLEDFYRMMDTEERLELIREYLETARYLKEKSDKLFGHVAIMSCITEEENSVENRLVPKMEKQNVPTRASLPGKKISVEKP